MLASQPIRPKPRPPARELTPREIVEELDKYIIGQEAAKRAVAIALRNRYRRKQLPPELRDEVLPKNILMIGRTGVGKTEIARRLAKLANAPFIKVEATKFTEVGYVGRDVDSMVRELVDAAVRMVEEEKMTEVWGQAERRALEIIVDALMDSSPRRHRREPFRWFSEAEDWGEEASSASRSLRRQRLQEVREGLWDSEMIEVEVEESPGPVLNVMSAGGMEEIINLSDLMGGLFPKRKRQRRMTVAEAKQILTRQEAEKLLDRESIVREAIERAENDGIIFVDELDKIAGREAGPGPDVSREGVQRDILPIVEGCTVMTKYGPVNTHHILFIAAGAFHVSKPSDLIPELQGRFPIRVELEDLSKEDLKRILVEPENALVKQYQALLATEGVQVEFTEEAIEEIAEIAWKVNEQTENIGARRLHTVMEKLLEELSFAAPEVGQQTVTITREYVRQRLAGIVKDEDLSRYIL